MKHDFYGKIHKRLPFISKNYNYIRGTNGSEFDDQQELQTSDSF